MKEFLLRDFCLFSSQYEYFSFVSFCLCVEITMPGRVSIENFFADVAFFYTFAPGKSCTTSSR